MDRSERPWLLAVLGPLAMACLLGEPAHAGEAITLTLADGNIGGRSFGYNAGFDVDPVTNDVANGSSFTRDGILFTFDSDGGVVPGTQDPLNRQRMHLNNSGLGVRGGGSGWLNTGESLILTTSHVVTLTELIFARRPIADGISFDLFVDGNRINEEHSPFTGSNILNPFGFELTGTRFEILTRGGEGRLAQFSVSADALASVPEPSTLVLAACGAVIGLTCYGRSRGRGGRERSEA